MIKKKEFIHCEACGGYHDKDESEIVIIKIVKGKDCVINPNILRTPEATVVVPPKIEVVKDEPIKSDVKVDPDGIGYHIPPKEREEQIKKVKNIIPTGLGAGVFARMIPPGSNEFETRSAKEVRQY